jgi:imidazolonepropionase-like amidohydrolase
MKTIQIKLFTICYALFVAMHLHAQQTMVIIQGGTIHLGNGKVIENGYLGFADGKIILCDSQMTAMYKNARIINAKTKHIYPGIICMNTYVGLNEIDAVRATKDMDEVGGINPNVRALIAYNTDSKVTPTIKSNGITMVQVVPQGGLISGTSSVMKTEGWNWEDAVYKMDDGVHINWPELLSWRNEKTEDMKQRLDKELYNINDFFEQGEQYHRIEKHEVVNVRLEAMRGLFAGTKNLYVHVNSAKGIISSIQFLKKYPQIKMVLVGAADSYKLKELIKENNIPVVLSNIHRLPQRANEDVDQPYKTPFELMQAGITVAIGHSGSWEVRNLLFNTGTGVAYGLSKEQALMCITQNPAKIMGFDKTCGTLEIGKDATLIISSGDVLDMKSSMIEQAFIGGEELDLNNQQKELYKKFSKKYQIKE